MSVASSVDDRFFREVMATSTSGLVSLDEDGTVIFANPAVERLLGYDPDELIGTPLERIVPEGDGAHGERHHRLLAVGEESTDGRTSFRLSLDHAEGYEVSLEAVAEATEYEGRRFTLLRLEDGANRSDAAAERFRKVFEHSNDAILIIDPTNDEFRACNPRACEMLGYTRGELLETAPSEIHPHELARFREFVEEVFEEGSSWTDELSCYTANEERVPAEISASAIEVDGHPHVLALIRDISDRVARERQLEALNDATRELIVAENEREVAEVVVDIVGRVFDRSLSTVWSYDEDREVLVPLAATEAAAAEGMTGEEGEIGTGTVEMEAFFEGESTLLREYQGIEDRAHPEMPLEMRLLEPVGDHGLLAIGARSPGTIDPPLRKLIDIVVRSTRAALDRIERERKARRHSAAMDAANDGIAILDEDEEFTYVNGGFAEAHGYESPEELVGETWRVLYGEEQCMRLEWDVLPTVWSEGHWRGEVTAIGADGGSLPQELSITKLDDSTTVCVARDISERKDHENQLEALNEVSRELIAASTREEIATVCVEAIEPVVGVEVGCLRLFDAEEKRLETLAQTDAAAELLATRMAYDLDATHAGHAYRRQETVEIETMADDPYDPEYSSLHAPIGTAGVLTVVAREGSFDERARRMTEALAVTVETALAGAEQDRLLQERERELRQQHDQLETLNRINRLVREITTQLVESGGREELERRVCEHLTASELYRSAWIGAVQAGDEQVVPRIGAGVDDDYLEGMRRMPRSMLANGAVEAAIESGETEVVRQYQLTAGEEDGSGGDGARGRFEAVAAIPLGYGDRLSGVLVVDGAREDVFEEKALEGFDSLGKAVGFAMNAIRNRKLLVADTVVEIELDIADPSLFYTGVTERLDCRCRYLRSVPVGDGRHVNYHRVEGTDPQSVLDFAEADDVIEEITVISERDDGFVIQTTERGSAVEFASDVGVRIRSAVAEDGVGRLTLEAPENADVREIVEAYRSVFSGIELVSKRDRERSVPTDRPVGDSVDEQLTEKQRAALEAAYFAGYYDWPRETTAQELAESMGISSSTLHQHLRKGTHALVSSYVEEPVG